MLTRLRVYCAAALDAPRVVGDTERDRGGTGRPGEDLRGRARSHGSGCIATTRHNTAKGLRAADGPE